jgi:hypothetical protein
MGLSLGMMGWLMPIRGGDHGRGGGWSAGTAGVARRALRPPTAPSGSGPRPAEAAARPVEVPTTPHATAEFDPKDVLPLTTPPPPLPSPPSPSPAPRSRPSSVRTQSADTPGEAAALEEAPPEGPERRPPLGAHVSAHVSARLVAATATASRDGRAGGMGLFGRHPRPAYGPTAKGRRAGRGSVTAGSRGIEGP